MHSLLFKRSESPKTMEKVKEFGKQAGEVDDPPQPDSLISLFSTVNVLRADEYCQPCKLPVNYSNLPHSSTCSYGIQALLHNVHRGYATDGERTPDHQIASLPPAQDSDSSHQLDSEILRQWKRKKEEELQERKRESQAKLDHILEQAAIERETFYKEREAQIEAKKQLNREREAKYRGDVETKQKEQLAGGNLWEAVGALIDLHGQGDYGIKPPSTTNSKHSLSPKSIGEHQLSPAKPKPDGAKSRPRDCLPKLTKKSADLSRMREILLKLQHQPLVR